MLRLDREHTEEEEYFPFSSSYWENRGLRRRLAADLFSILVRYFPLLYPEYSLFPRRLPGLSATCGAPCGRNAALHRRALRMRTELNKPTGNAHAQSGLIFPFCVSVLSPRGSARYCRPRHPGMPRRPGLPGGCFWNGIRFRRDRKPHPNSCFPILQQRTLLSKRNSSASRTWLYIP